VAGALTEVVRRAKRYVDAGCDGVFVPGLSTVEGLARVAAEVPVPLNIWAAPTLPPLEQLRVLGVRRVSVGPRIALTALSAARRGAGARGPVGTHAGWDDADLCRGRWLVRVSTSRTAGRDHGAPEVGWGGSVKSGR
jgi:2-methylisocitrate lyase-like PEP mutase family enzyme